MALQKFLKLFPGQILVGKLSGIFPESFSQRPLLTILLFLIATMRVVLASCQAAEDPSQISTFSYSNQWIFERTGSFLYLTVNRAQLQQSSLRIDRFESSFGDSSFYFPSIEYFTRVTDFANLEGKSFLRYFSLWARYGFGAAIRSGTLSNTEFALTSSESATLLGLNTRLGLNLAFERFGWFRPFLGTELFAFFYRHSASLSGAEIQGIEPMTSLVLGAHFPLFFEGRGSLFIEGRRDISLAAPNRILAQGFNADLGAGLSF